MRSVKKISALILIANLLVPSLPSLADTTPTPTPTPTPAPAPGPTPEQLAAARALGVEDGRSAGIREAEERATPDARQDGLKAGREKGYDRCEREERQKAHDRGYRDGYIVGQGEGNYAGDRQGRADGAERGTRDGQADGLRRANNDAMRDATGPGRQRGYEEANASDATARGDRDGTAQGDADARAEAERVDYPRGRVDYRNERLAERVENQDSFDQKSVVEQVAKAVRSGSETLASKLLKIFGGKDVAADIMNLEHNVSDVQLAKATAPDNRYFNPNRTFPSTGETNAYREGYRQGYNNGFSTRYNAVYNEIYERALQNGIEQGCKEAREKDYRGAYNRGYDEGRQRGYADAYNYSYDRVFRPTYDEYFRANSDEAYRNSYQGYYDQHFEAARSAAYQERYNELYRAAYNRAHAAKYAEMYPGYAAAAYKRGRADEEQDFKDRPVRLLGAEATETIDNGLMEPGEELRIRLQMRNFSASALNGRDIKVVLQALDASSAVISEAEGTLVQNLKRKSVTSVGEALSFRMNENAVNRAKNFRVTLYYQNRNVGEETIQIVSKFMVDMRFAEAPELKEGLESTLKVRLVNQSTKATDAGLKVSFRSNPEILEILKDTIEVGILNPGEERVIEFPVIARQRGAYINVPVVFLSTLGNGRRVGVIDEERSVPLVNDYRIEVGASVRNLRNTGITRIEYTIRNVGSRLLMKGLQLKVKINGENAGNFAVVGPNPQYLTPLVQGQALTFVVPVLAKSANTGGVLELEVQEDGRTVVISRAEF